GRRWTAFYLYLMRDALRRKNRTAQPAKRRLSPPVAAGFTFGNPARNLPDVSAGIANYSFVLFENTAITEKVGLQFRTEVFNLFNRVQFNSPGLQQGNPQFGVISGRYNDPRLIQFALRLLF